MADGCSKQILLNMIFNYTSPMKKGFDGEIVASLLPINQKFVWTQHLFGPNIFLDQKFFWTQIFFGQKSFWT